MSRHSERGAIFIHVAIGLLVLLMIGAWVIDYGALWTARGQAQNAADAGALSGAQALAFDNVAGVDRWDRARNVAWNAANRNAVWASAPSVDLVSPYDGSVDAMTIPQCEALPQTCIRVRTFRDGTNGSTAMPTFLANLFGTSTQGTRAIAVAQAAPASGSSCLKPWLVPDRWLDSVMPADKYNTGDTYVAPKMQADGSINYGTGYTPQDIGTPIVLKPGNPSGTIAPSDYYEVDDPEFEVSGGRDYGDAIAGCVLSRNVGDTISIKPGSTVGPTQDGFNRLIAASGGTAIVVVGMFDPAEFASRDRQSGNSDITIVNMLAMKLTASSMNGGTITATIWGAPSDILNACEAPPCATTSGLVQVIRLLR